MDSSSIVYLIKWFLINKVGRGFENFLKVFSGTRRVSRRARRCRGSVVRSLIAQQG